MLVYQRANEIGQENMVQTAFFPTKQAIQWMVVLHAPKLQKRHSVGPVHFGLPRRWFYVFLYQRNWLNPSEHQPHGVQFRKGNQPMYSTENIQVHSIRMIPSQLSFTNLTGSPFLEWFSLSLHRDTTQEFYRIWTHDIPCVDLTYQSISCISLYTPYIIFWLVVLTCFNHLEKYEFVNGKDDIPYIMENKNGLKPPTSITFW